MCKGMAIEADVIFVGVLFLVSLALEYLDALGCIPYLYRPLAKWCGLGGTTLAGIIMWSSLLQEDWALARFFKIRLPKDLQI